MTATTRLALPMMIGSQAQKHVTHNEALAQLDIHVHLSVLDDDRTGPPSGSLPGDLHLVAPGATGDWSGRDGRIAHHTGAGWEYLTPGEGWRCWIAARGVLRVFSAGHWRDLAGESVDRLGVNTTADAVNRLAVKSDAVVLSHDDHTPGSGDMLLQINRADDAKAAAVRFSSDWSVRAEAGIAGDDVFRLKVSDGGPFRPALTIDTATGDVGIGTEPAGIRLAVREDVAGTAQFSVSNYSTDAAAAAAFRLNVANGHYFSFQLYGSGSVYAYTSASMTIGTYAPTCLAFRTDTTDRLVIHPDGRISVNNMVASAQLSVNGPIRAGQYVKAELPDPSTNGAGALIFVADANGGSVMAFSDGAMWRRTTDRTVID